MLGKINIFEDTEAASKYGISSVPTFILLNDDGIEVSRRTGTQSRPHLIDWINTHVK